jgi:transcriptional regulator of acetoin/glycerol metabolism
MTSVSTLLFYPKKVSRGPGVIVPESIRQSSDLDTYITRKNAADYEFSKQKKAVIASAQRTKQMSDQLEKDGKNKEAARRAEAAEREAEEAKARKIERSYQRKIERLARTEATTTQGQGGGFRHKKPSVPQSKEILGKIRRIYKVAGSRKEHVKYKGELIPVSDYKKLMKLKR